MFVTLLSELVSGWMVVSKHAGGSKLVSQHRGVLQDEYQVPTGVPEHVLP